MMCLPNALSTTCTYVLVLQIETGVKHVNHDNEASLSETPVRKRSQLRLMLHWLRCQNSHLPISVNKIDSHFMVNTGCTLRGT